MDPLEIGLGSTAPRLNQAAEERAVEICARLLIDRYIAKREYRDLLIDDELRAMSRGVCRESAYNWLNLLVPTISPCACAATLKPIFRSIGRPIRECRAVRSRFW